MKSNNYLLSHNLQIRIQGLVGELVALDYVINNLKLDEGDGITIATNRCNIIKLSQIRAHPLVGFITVNKSPFEFLRHELVDNFQQIGCEGIDLTNADIEVKDLFNKYMSKTKEQILSKLEQIYTKEREKYAKEREKAKEETERRIKERKKEGIDDDDNEMYKTMISEIINTLSHEDCTIPSMFFAI